MNIKQSLTLFGLTDAASPKELQAAYRQGVKKWHPDRFQQAEEASRLQAEQKMRELNIAFEALNEHFAKHGHFQEVFTKPAPAKPATKSYYRKQPAQAVEQEVEPEIVTPVQKPASRRVSMWFGLAFSLLAGVVVFSGFLPESSHTVYSDRHAVMDKQTSKTNDLQTTKTLEQNTIENQQTTSEDNIALVEKLKKPVVKEEVKSAFETRSIFTKEQPLDPEEPFFSYGDSMGKVYEVQGIPTRTEGDIWYYGSSEVHFKNGRVVAWENTGRPMLKVRF